MNDLGGDRIGHVFFERRYHVTHTWPGHVTTTKMSAWLLSVTSWLKYLVGWVHQFLHPLLWTLILLKIIRGKKIKSGKKNFFALFFDIR